MIKFLTHFRNYNKLNEETTYTQPVDLATLTHCGDYAGKFQSETYDIITQEEALPPLDEEPLQWTDIMYSNNGKVYAVWSTDEVTTFHGKTIKIEIEKEDYPKHLKKCKKR